jgi:hypothetical protein
MDTTTQLVIDWSRFFISDSKTRLKTVRKEEIGRTHIATTSRETFYLKQAATGTVSLYIEPYKFTSTASLSAAATTDRVFQYNATLQSCIIPKNSDPSIRPAQFKAVLADYKYTEGLPYAYSDIELVEFLPAAISYLNNTFGFTYTYTGTGDTFVPAISTGNDTELVARALAIIVRKSFVSEQMKRGFGVAFRGPMAAIDSKAQMKEYNIQTRALETAIGDKITRDKVAGIDSVAQVIDIYDETVVET